MLSTGIYLVFRSIKLLESTELIQFLSLTRVFLSQYKFLSQWIVWCRALYNISTLWIICSIYVFTLISMWLGAIIFVLKFRNSRYEKKNSLYLSILFPWIISYFGTRKFKIQILLQSSNSRFSDNLYVWLFNDNNVKNNQNIIIE